MSPRDEVALRLAEAVAQIIAARTEQVSGANPDWLDDSKRAFTELFQTAHGLVLPSKNRGENLG